MSRKVEGRISFKVKRKVNEVRGEGGGGKSRVDSEGRFVVWVRGYLLVEGNEEGNERKKEYREEIERMQGRCDSCQG